MMALRTRRNVRPFKQPHTDAESVGAQIRTNFAIELLGEQDGFSQVRAVAPGGLVVEGWLANADLVDREVPVTSDGEIDIPLFAELVMNAARMFETSTEYLL